jgi:hypothetical protein
MLSEAGIAAVKSQPIEQLYRRPGQVVVHYGDL